MYVIIFWHYARFNNNTLFNRLNIILTFQQPLFSLKSQFYCRFSLKSDLRLWIIYYFLKQKLWFCEFFNCRTLFAQPTLHFNFLNQALLSKSSSEMLRRKIQSLLFVANERVGFCRHLHRSLVKYSDYKTGSNDLNVSLKCSIDRWKNLTCWPYDRHS